MGVVHRLFATALLLFIATTCVSGCGITTHSTIARRAADYFYTSRFAGYNDIINQYRDAYIAGAPFPDYGYACGTDHDAGEDAHWPPFHKLMAEYIRNQTKPWTEDTKKSVAFFLGMVSHYIADLTWHGMGGVQFGYGFIQTQGMLNFHCHGDLCSDSHDAADTGGEFVAAWLTDLSWFKPTSWYLPSHVLGQIFALDNHPTMTEQIITKCKTTFEAGGLAIIGAGATLYPSETQKAPWMQEHYLSHPLGGIDDMAIWTGRMADRFIDWIENGPPPNVDPQLINRPPAYIKMMKQLAPLVMHSPLYPPAPEVHESTENYQLWHSKLQSYIHSLIYSFLHHHSSSSSSSSSSSRPVFTSTLSDITKEQYHALEYLTEKYSLTLDKIRPPTTSLLHSSESEIVPATTVSVVAPSTTIHTAVAAATATASAGAGTGTGDAQVLLGQQNVQYYGSAVVSGDFDADGIQDMAIGSYGAGSSILPQTGSVELHLSSSPSQPIILSTNKIYSRFGWSLSVVDFNVDGVDDLVVGAPTDGWNWTEIQVSETFLYNGSVYIYYGSHSFSSKTQPDYTITSTLINENFGDILYVADIDKDGHHDLLIGSPLAAVYDDSNYYPQAGSIRIFMSSSSRQPGTTVYSAESDCYLSGIFQNGAHFGQSLALTTINNQSTLLVGATGVNIGPDGSQQTVGRIYAYTIPAPTAPNQCPVTSATAFTITGVNHTAELGRSIAAGSVLINQQVTNVIAIGIPSSTFNNSYLTSFTGSVVVFSAEALTGDISLSNLLSSSSVHSILYNQHYSARFGRDMQFVHITSLNVQDLIINSPLQTDGNEWWSAPRQVGSIYLYAGQNFPTGIVNDATTVAAWSYTGSYKIGRYGSAFAVTDLKNDGHKQLIVSAPLATVSINGVNKEQAGAVYIHPF